MQRLVLPLALVVCAAAWTVSPPHAQASRLPFIPAPGDWVLMPGISGGATLPARGRAGTFGGELSLACFGCAGLSWVGAYADALHDLGRDQWRISFGPELGSGLLGFDGGAVIAVDHGQARAGVTARAVLALGFIGAYVRVGQLFIESHQTYAELGAYLKFPINLGGGRDDDPRSREARRMRKPAPPFRTQLTSVPESW